MTNFFTASELQAIQALTKNLTDAVASRITCQVGVDLEAIVSDTNGDQLGKIVQHPGESATEFVFIPGMIA